MAVREVTAGLSRANENTMASYRAEIIVDGTFSRLSALTKSNAERIVLRAGNSTENQPH